MHRSRQPPIHPFALPILLFIAVAVLGVAYWAFGVGKDAFLYATAALVVFAIPLVAVFGVTGLVLGMGNLGLGSGLLRCKI